MLSKYNWGRLVAMAFMLAVQYLKDRNSTYSYFAKICGISCAEMYGLEVNMSDVLGWKLYVCRETFKLFE